MNQQTGRKIEVRDIFYDSFLAYERPSDLRKSKESFCKNIHNMEFYCPIENGVPWHTWVVLAKHPDTDLFLISPILVKEFGDFKHLQKLREDDNQWWFYSPGFVGRQTGHDFPTLCAVILGLCTWRAKEDFTKLPTGRISEKSAKNLRKKLAELIRK